jgi:hypothetical protein
MLGPGIKRIIEWGNKVVDEKKSRWISKPLEQNQRSKI